MMRWKVYESSMIPSNVEVVGEFCFGSCHSLCEVGSFESSVKLKEIHIKGFKFNLEVYQGENVEDGEPVSCMILQSL